MKIKLLEVRDRGTLMPCFAFKPNEAYRTPNSCPTLAMAKESFLVGRSGYGGECDAVVFGSLVEPSRCQYDCYAWNDGARTLKVAHLYVTEHWDEIESGDLIDVEFILGETKETKKSEAFL